MFVLSSCSVSFKSSPYRSSSTSSPNPRIQETNIKGATRQQPSPSPQNLTKIKKKKSKPHSTEIAYLREEIGQTPPRHLVQRSEIRAQHKPTITIPPRSSLVILHEKALKEFPQDLLHPHPTPTLERESGDFGLNLGQSRSRVELITTTTRKNKGFPFLIILSLLFPLSAWKRDLRRFL